MGRGSNVAFGRSRPPPMLRQLFQPKRLPLTLLVLAIAALFVRLGVWQLDRHQQVLEENRVGQNRILAPPLDEVGLNAGAEEAPDAIEFRPVKVSGVYAPADEVLIRSQVHLGTAGFHVVTPLVLDGASAVLVNRGWVPLVFDTVPVAQAPPPAGERQVEGWVALSQDRPSFGPRDPEEGRLEVMSRVDIERIQAQTELELLGVYLVAVGTSGELPEPIDPPSFDDRGPHLGYAVQWFGFAAIGLVGYPLLVRRRSGQSR
jgi:surfeit locus 1 family protein